MPPRDSRRKGCARDSLARPAPTVSSAAPAQLLVQRERLAEPEAPHRGAARRRRRCRGLRASAGRGSGARAAAARTAPPCHRASRKRPVSSPGGVPRAVLMRREAAPGDGLGPSKLDRVARPIVLGREAAAGRDPLDQIGCWTRSVPGDHHVTGDRRAIFRKRGGAPPSVPKTQPGAADGCSTPDERELRGPLRRKRGRSAPAGAERAHQHDAADTTLACTSKRGLPVPAAITRSNVAGAPATRDEVHDRRTPRAAASSEAGSVTSPRTSWQSMPSRHGGAPRRPDERTRPALRRTTRSRTT